MIVRNIIFREEDNIDYNEIIKLKNKNSIFRVGEE